MRSQPIKAHSIQTLKNFAIFAMLRGVTVFLDKPLYLLKSGNDALLAGRASAFLLRLREVVQFRAQSVEVHVTHSDPHPCSGQRRRRLRPSSFPRHPARCAMGAVTVPF